MYMAASDANKGLRMPYLMCFKPKASAMLRQPLQIEGAGLIGG
jgi:hypothetical protein